MFNFKNTSIARQGQSLKIEKKKRIKFLIKKTITKHLKMKLPYRV